MSEKHALIAGRYRLDELIGRGGMGDVFKGTDTHTGEAVAIKRLHQSVLEENPDILDRFTREGEALRQLNHPNIVTMRAMVAEESRHYLVMEYVGGGSLRNLLDVQGRLPLEGVLNIALDLADALTRAHRLHIVHRDIKPDNVLLAEDGTPRLTDFGVAHLGDRTRLTQTGSVIGTYAYLSPEACNGLELDERADIWAFGVMLFEMLTGRVPFQGDSTAAILTAILTKPAPDIDRLRPGLPPALITLIARMLEKDRARRISSVRLVGAELEAIIRNIDTPLRSLVLSAQNLAEGESRFATPSDEVPAAEVPAMARGDAQQTHGLTLYPPLDTPDGEPPMLIPGVTPVTGEYTAASAKWKWIALMVIVVALGCSVVLVAAILSGGARSRTDERAVAPTSETPPPATATGGEATGEPEAMLWPEIAPVAPGQYQVLVARFEDLSGIGQIASGRQVDVTRLVADHLVETLEKSVPFSNIAVRRYGSVVTSSEQAQAVAAYYGATVIVWGNYTPDLIEANVQIGVLNAFRYNRFPRDTLERTANVRLHMADARRESLAPFVLSVLNILHNADGNAFETMRSVAIQDAITVQPAEITGSSVAAQLHRAMLADDPREEGAALDAALSLDAGNALLYTYTAILKQSQGRAEDSRADALTAQRLGPSGWVMPLMLLAHVAYDESVFQLFDQVIAARADDWFPRFYRGAIYYVYGSVEPGARDLARADLDAAIALRPVANFPYVFRVLLALHESRLDDAFRDIEIVLTQFPDPGFMGRLVVATFGDQSADPYAVILSAVANQMLGRHDLTIEETSAGLEVFPDFTDLYMVQGVSYCSLGEYAAAEAAFSAALAHEPNFLLVRLLRADARLQRGDTEGANQDLREIAASALSETFEPYAAAIQAGEVGCATFFTPENPLSAAGMAQAAGDATPAPPGEQLDPLLALALRDVAPVNEGEYMVLLARPEALERVPLRDVNRFIADDLERTLAGGAPYSRIAVRQLPVVITSAEEARIVAEAVGATVIVWGNYSPDLIELNIQVGTTREFPYNRFSRDLLEKTGSVRVHLSNERSESIARPIIGITSLLSMADGDLFEFVLNLTILDSLRVVGASVVGADVAAHMHRALDAFSSNTRLAIDEFGLALALDSGNPLLYSFRSIAHLRNGALDRAAADIGTAARLAPVGWAMPVYLSFDQAASDSAIVAQYSQVIALRPDDWYAYFTRAMYRYGEAPQAVADLEQAIALGPEANLPYVAALLIALREGHLADAQDLARTILEQFPDPELTNRAFATLYGSQAASQITGAYFAAVTNIVLGQYSRVVDDLSATIALIPPDVMSDPAPDQDAVLSDLFLVYGLAHCSLDRYEDAEAAFSQAIRFNKGYALAYVLRGQMRSVLGDEAGAARDFAGARGHKLGDEFDRWIDTAEQNRWTCATLWDYTPPE